MFINVTISLGLTLSQFYTQDQHNRVHGTCLYSQPLERLTQEEHELETTLDNTVRPCLKKNKKNKTKEETSLVY
jgi:hypothetical protein